MNDHNRSTRSTTLPVALITGAARRIGACIAERLHGCGYAVVIQYHDSEAPALALAERLNGKRDGSAVALKARLAEPGALSRPGQPGQLVEESVAHFGRLDLLVNNASTFPGSNLADTTGPEWDTMFAVNCKTPFFLAQTAAPHLRRVHGCIINITDFYARHPKPGAPVYCATQAALESLTRSLALELAPQVRVNAVAPGAILAPQPRTGRGDKGSEGYDEAGIIAKTPLARRGTPEEIAATVVFLARDAGFITGETISVDGGRPR